MKLDCEAIRFRLEIAGDAIGIPWAEVEPIIKASDTALLGLTETQTTQARLIELCLRYGVSLDWLVTGDVRGMIAAAAETYRRERRP